MKKTILLLVAIALTSAKMMAEGLTATLQQGETMTAFYGVNAFVDAYNAAENGAVITLSEGQFNDVTTIEKSITVVGNMAFDVEGYKKTYLGNSTDVTINADNVTIEGICFYNYSLILGNISNCHIRRCRIVNTLYNTAKTTNTNTLIDQCVLNTINLFAASKNICIKNCTIYRLGGGDAENVGYISNCYINRFFARSSSSDNQLPYAIYKNNVLGFDYNSYSGYTCDLKSPSEFYNNYFLYIGSYSSSKVSIYINQGNVFSENVTYKSNNAPTNFIIDSFGMLGDDGTPIGITGGSGFSPYPSIPRITSKQIDSKTDSEGKLNVKITVSTEETLVKEEKPEDNPVEEPTE